jgi:hypothetical protein
MKLGAALGLGGAVGLGVLLVAVAACSGGEDVADAAASSPDGGDAGAPSPTADAGTPTPDAAPPGDAAPDGPPLFGPATSAGLGPGTTCAVGPAGEVFCWGANTSSALGDGTTLPANRPVKVVGLTSPVTAVVTGEMHACAQPMVFERPLCVALDGFTLHAATRAGGLDAPGSAACSGSSRSTSSRSCSTSSPGT